MDTLTMMQGASQGGVIASNAGYSGTPLWKLQQQGLIRKQQMEAQEAAAREAEAAKEAALAEEEEPAERLRVAVDAVSMGRSEGSGEKPLVRHVIVKDLRKVAARSKVGMPSGGVFEGKVPVMLFALFDGQSTADQPGPLCAEWCSKNMLPKLLRNLSALPQGYENDVFIKATLKKTFEDLDKEVLQGQPAIHDGCGAAVALLVGERLFTATIGKCHAILCEAGPPKAGQVNYKANSLGANQGACDLPDERKWLTDNGGVVFTAENGKTLVSSPGGAVSAVSRSLGDRAWKGEMGGIPGSVKLVRGIPETRSTELSWADRHGGLILTSAPIYEAVPATDCAAIASTYPGRARATCGEIAAKAVQAAGGANAQHTSLVVYFLPKVNTGKEAGAPPAKKAKKEAESVRVRHIVLKFRDCGQAFDPVRNRPIARSREEAETTLRGALRELCSEQSSIKRPGDASKAKLAALQPTPKYIQLCKDLSECTTAQKGGGMMGDLGWLTSGELQRFGPAFAETVKALEIGQWSDITSSEHGVHICQRIA
eukprot:TRINITY_DN36562_c0_g1_i1.p1 TRINITY_DN36562_c0_g1~~TRINITY_DN36562_c0_g1_i1.p1  ORF type:complete len:541 (-),score=130.73 TRINITY_DN36562_c0_g1_i1:299-1921(-)